MYQPVHATGDEWRLAALNGSGVVDVLIVDLAGAATIKGTNAGLTLTDRDSSRLLDDLRSERCAAVLERVRPLCLGWLGQCRF
jgi:hypothetical protein